MNSITATLKLDFDLLIKWVKNRQYQLSRDVRFPTMWYVRPAKAQTSLRISAV